MSHDDPAELGTFVLPTLTSRQAAGRSERVNSLAPLAAIDSLLSEKRKAREALDADIAALERSRELLAGVLLPSRPAESVVAAGAVMAAGVVGAAAGVVGAAGSVVAASVVGAAGAVSSAASASSTIAPGAWHEAALAVFNDGATHTTAEVYEAAKAAVGPELGYSAVASWLNRVADRGQLKKDGRGEFSLPVSREKTSEEGTVAA